MPCYWSLSIPPENIRKPLVCCCFQGVKKEASGTRWVKQKLRFCAKYFYHPFLRRHFMNIYFYSFSKSNYQA